MAVEEQNNKNNEGKGFAGLSSLVSEIDTAPTPIPPREESVETTDPTGRPEKQPAKSTSQSQPQRQINRQPYQEPVKPSPGSSGGKWILGIAALAGFIWLISLSDKNNSSPTPTSSTSVQSQGSSVLQESKPPVGRDLVLSTAQIRYCLAEDIRLEGAKGALNNYSDFEVRRFNTMVADYNGRCGNFRYKGGALNNARRDVEPYRDQLQAEGRSRFVQSSNKASSSVPPKSRPVADPTVQAIQRKLNELGYQAGSADGLMGRVTRSAIIAFQQERGLKETGLADQALLLQLQSAPARSRESDNISSTNSSASSRAGNEVPQSQYLNSTGKPDLSRATSSEQTAIENACGYHKRINGPADYYRCQQTELSKLSKSDGQPDLSRATSSEKASIENACGYHKRINGPADYYQCQRTELNKLSSSSGPPDLTRISAFERASIENACGYHKRINGPADYYRCQQTELSKLSRSGGQPDLSVLSLSERASIEDACGYHKRINGPADYYQCQRIELRKLR